MYIIPENVDKLVQEGKYNEAVELFIKTKGLSRDMALSLLSKGYPELKEQMLKMLEKENIFYEISELLKKNGDAVTDSYREDLCRFFTKNISERIAFVHKFDQTGPQRVVISEKGIYNKLVFKAYFITVDSLSFDVFFSWEEIDRVEYSLKDKDFYIYFSEGYEHYFRIGRFDLTGSFSSDFCLQIADKFTRYAKFHKGYDDLIDDVILLSEEGKHQEAFELADKLVKDNQDDEDSLIFLKALRGKERLYIADSMFCSDSESEDAEKLCDSAIVDLKWSLSKCNTSEETKEWETYIHYLLSTAYNIKVDVRKCRIHSIGALSDERFAEEMRATLDKIDTKKSYYDNYLDTYDYPSRKFIMPLKSIDGCYSDKIEVFLLQKMPKGIMFPSGMVKENQIYIGHPYNKAVYVPLQDMEEIFFVDKIHELCYLLQCLGAEEISITSIAGKKISELENSTQNISGNTDVKSFSGQFDVSSNSSIKKDTTSNNERTIKYTLDPMRSPFVPEGLVWYPMVPEWQRLVKSRMDTNVLEYSETVSTSQVRFASDTEKEELKVSASYLWAKANISIDTNADNQFKETVETQWKVDVKFRSLKDFDNESECCELSKDEKEYLEELKVCLTEDAQISPVERRLLDKYRDRLGISKERVDELERMVLRPVSTDEEKEYIEIIKELGAEGDMTERKRRMLERERIALGITESRAKELEKM